MNLLFVCTAGEQRSFTGADIYGKKGYDTRFAGVHGIGEKTLTREDLQWADRVIVMEPMHREFIRRNFPTLFQTHEIIVLNIPDIYLRHDPELVDLIERNMPEL